MRGEEAEKNTTALLWARPGARTVPWCPFMASLAGAVTAAWNTRYPDMWPNVTLGVSVRVSLVADVGLVSLDNHVHQIARPPTTSSLSASKHVYFNILGQIVSFTMQNTTEE